MKTTILAIASLLLSTSASAEGIQLHAGAQTNRVGRLSVFAGSLALGSLASVNVHEGSHALAGMALGHHVSEYRPLPHMQDGRFVFGSVSAGYHPIISAAPLASDVLLFASTDLALRAVPKDSPAAPAMLAVGMVWPTIDAIRALTLVGNREGDLNRACRGLRIPPAAGAAIVGALVGVAVWRIVDQAIQIANAR